MLPQEQDAPPRVSPVTVAPLVVGSLVAPPDALRRFRLSHADLMPVMRRFELDWPCCLPIMQRFAEYVTNVLACDPQQCGLRAGPPVPVLHLCLQKGLCGYDAAADECDDVRLLAFIDGVCLEAARLLGGVSLFKPNNDCWMAGQGVALHGWLAADREGAVSVHSSQRRGASRDRIRAAVAHHVMSPRERHIIDRVRQKREVA